MTRPDSHDDVGTPSVRQHGLMPVAYHQFRFVDGDWPPAVRSEPANGLALACPDAVVLWAGIHTGVVGLAVEIAGQRRR